MRPMRSTKPTGPMKSMKSMKSMRSVIPISLIAAALAAALAAGCGGHAGAVSSLRYHNQPAVWRVDDRRDVPQKPEERAFAKKLYYFDSFVYDPVQRLLSVPASRRAMNVNALGEVPDSTWFTNRIGVRPLSVDDVRRGPRSPDQAGAASGPWTVISSKVGGVAAGFVARDARGGVYIVKFDPPGAPETESGADVVVQRLLWAAGYNVPEDEVVHLAREDLTLAPDARVKDMFGNARPMTEADLEEQLARGHRLPDGRYRVLASKFLPGAPIGGFPLEGVRPDDPNDVIPHEHRRELRGLYLFAAWMQQTDLKEDNVLDIWVEGDDGRHYVEHYLIDFGKSLGTNALILQIPGDGHVYNLDLPHTLMSLATLGLWKRPYEGARLTDIPGLGLFDSEHFRPGGYKPTIPFAPFLRVDALDLFWAAKIIMRFTPAHLRAAVEQARYSDPRAVDYLVEMLVARQRTAARHAFDQVNPLDGFMVRRDGDAYALCFDDLLVRHGLVPAAGSTTRYRARSHGFDGAALGWEAGAMPGRGAGHQGSACVRGLVPGGSHDGYTIVRLDTVRAGRSLPPVEVHLAADPATGALRVIGVHRHLP